MTVEEIQKLVQEVIKEVLDEQEGGAIGNVTAAVSGGQGPPRVPAAFAKPGQGKNRATKQAERLGYTTVKRPKHPSHTKMFDYLDEKKR